ncbi:MAG: reverse transcriptase [Pseudopedobacter saltans]|uniref:Reverse transcriptase n=1 Tax=Pseudopedobacter saltans TaxID=151895 RepID=A0A2W5HFH8_9SPHI|nr:MAG: reverse transcriptase [Pseudopedobacter saltans]
MKNIIELNNKDAKAFFLKSSSYCKLELPQYYKFENVLKGVGKKMGKNSLPHFFATNRTKSKSFRPQDFDEVNYMFLNNKDGKYAWRPFQLIHPAIYVSLVKTITQKSNWDLIVNRFAMLHSNPKIRCLSMPMLSEDRRHDQVSSILNWWENVEQKSIELALEYSQVVHLDVTDCYSTIYTHSISWALHTKAVAKPNENKKSLLGNIVHEHFQWMSNGKANGIPQGSALMDFIAEIVLGYADEQLGQFLDANGITDYQILRYRDDYRIFTNSNKESDAIIKFVSECLAELGMRLNAQKTVISNDVIRTSIKEDKFFWLLHKNYSIQLDKQLLIIYNLSEKYPNSGSLVKALNAFYRRLLKVVKTPKNINCLASITVEIVSKNPRVYPVASAILGQLLTLQNDDQDKLEHSIMSKLSSLQNNGHLQVWLQRMSLKKPLQMVYSEPLCKVVENPFSKIWESSWLNAEMKQLIEKNPIVDLEALGKMDETISPKEINMFEY